MSIREVNPSSFEVDAIAEAQLQEELRSLFLVDTQNYLQKYSQLAQTLQPETWKSDIQELYRCIHTIKGGAVTVAAEAILQVSTALEDLLSDLRYLEAAPPLSDAYLSQSLLEGGELLTGVLVQDTTDIAPILRRVEALHQDVRERYLSQWNPQRQLHQDFAEQGLEMVVLELQIALERLPDDPLLGEEWVAIEAIDTAQQTLIQLHQFGDELQLASGWTKLLHQAEELFVRPTVKLWRSHWSLLFDALKTCAKQSGSPVVLEWNIPGKNSGENLEKDLEKDLEETRKEIREEEKLESLGDLGSPEVRLDEGIKEEVEAIELLIETEAIEEETLQEPASIAPSVDDLFAAMDLANPAPDSEQESALFAALDIASFLESDFLESDFLQSDFLESDFLQSDFLQNRALEISQPSIQLSAASDSADSGAEPRSDRAMQGDEVEAQPQESEPQLLPQDPSEDSSSELLSLTSVQEWLDLPAPLAGDLLEVDLSDIKAFDFSASDPLVADLLAPDLSIDRDLQPGLNQGFENGLGNGFGNGFGNGLRNSSGKESNPALNPAPDYAIAPQSRPAADPANIQIPVSLEKLDRSAQYLVETLLALRSTQGLYQTLQSQLTQLVALAQEGVQSITNLRQIQDDYALLDMQSKQSPQGLNPERYRQGYTVINRLLETNLRLSEIGAEAGKMTEQITENLRSVDGSVLKLQNTIEDSRLVSFQTLGMRARAVLRDLVTRYGKPARLIILGEQTELDVSTARDLEPALLHLVRNAYDHGLELPTERTAQGKPEQGTIVLSLRRRGNQFLLEFKDDGRGIDAAKIRSRAEAFNFPLSQTATSEELLRVICQPGFSSEAEATEISGRGVGMDVVAAQVSRLGGQLSLQTIPGTGTTFQLQFPAPRLLVPCILVRAGDYTFAIPEDEIKTITLWGNLNAVQNERPYQNSLPDPLLTNQAFPQTDNPDSAYRWVIQDETGSTPALDLLEYWQPHAAGRSLSETAVCLQIQTATSQTQISQAAQAEGVWLLADELLEQSELVINLLPSPLIAPTGVLGVSLQVNGVLVPVLEARSLVDWWLALPARQAAAEAIDAHETAELMPRPVQTVLVIDDAALMRRRVEASLSANGYAVHTCSDGQEAWHWLQEHPHPSLILTDIEMPNMDGFTLIDRCRQNGIAVPILVVSSRLSEEWFNEAKRLGANDYLTKGFATGDLLTKVNRLLSSS